MKLSQGFWQTHKEVPNDAVVPSHKLMVRAGLIHKAAGGLYNQLPMGLRAVRKVEQIIREELDRAGCYELLMTVVTPGELWQESGRWENMGPDMLKAKDRGGRDLCMSPTNEEAITDIFRKAIFSYKQLPVTLYQINTKFRDEIRPRYGVMRAREFIMKDAYSFHENMECMHKTYQNIYQAYERILKRIGLQYIAVEADGGAMADSGAQTHEFQVLAGSGEDRVIRCPKCGYAANVEKAKTLRQFLNTNKKADASILVETPNKSTIEDVCQFLKCEQSQGLKALVYSAVTQDKEEFVMAMLLGDDELNELKLKGQLKCDHLIPATDADFERLGIPKGYIGPHNLPREITKVFYDCLVDLDGGYVAGAMKRDYHLRNFIPRRDSSSFEVVDLRLSKASDQCEKCKGIVEEIRGIEVGHIFELGNKYTKSMNVVMIGEDGKHMHPLMGCYGLGVNRIVAAAIEQNHDENGIIWPPSIAPYKIHFVLIAKDQKIIELGGEIYQQLIGQGVEVLFDDRDARAGFKFKDADLLGLPICLVLGERDYNQDGMFEIRVRKNGKNERVKKEDLLRRISELLDE